MITVALSEIAEIQSGVGFPTKYQGLSGGDYPFAKVGDISEAKRAGGNVISTANNYISSEVCRKLKAKPFPVNTIVFAKIGEAIRNGNKVVTDRPMIFDNNVMGISPDERKVHPKYLYRFLDHLNFYSLANSTTVPSLRKTDMAALEIWLPPLDEQRRIAAILDQADELRRKRQRALDRLGQLGQSIFHEMFGDSTSNPKGWREDSLGSLVRKGDKINYGVVQPGDDVEDGVPLIRVGDLLKPVIDPSQTKRISTEIEANYKRSRLAGDEILIGCVGSIGTVALAHSGLKGANIARAVARVPVNPEVAEREFVAEMIRSPLVQRYFAAETRTVAQPTLNISLIVSAPIFVPPIQLQKEFVARISALRSALAGNGKSSVSLDELFSSLQHRAFRGEL